MSAKPARLHAEDANPLRDAARMLSKAARLAQMLSTNNLTPAERRTLSSEAIANIDAARARVEGA